MWGETTHQVVRRLIGNRQPFSTRDVAEQARVSRQAAQKLLRSWVNSGALTIVGKARAARYRPVDGAGAGQVDDSDPPSRPSGPLTPAWVDDSGGAGRGEVDEGFRRAAQLADFGSPYAAVPFTGPQAEPRRVTLEVASAGSLYRLSARMLLDGVDADEVLLDFTGVMDVSDEFLEEVFHVWGGAHPQVLLLPVHVPEPLAGMLDAVTP